MKFEWPTASVLELERAGALLVQDGNHGAYRPRPDEIVSQGIPHVRAADVSPDGSIRFDTAQRLADSAWDRIKKGRAQGGDVLLTHKGTVGRVAVVPPDPGRVLCSPQTTLWRSLDRSRLDQGFIAAYLRSDVLQTQLRRVMHESDMAPYVSLTSQRALRVVLPPMPDQRAIASVLGALDDKIESNRRLAENARSILRFADPRDGRPAPLDTVSEFRNGGALTKHATGDGLPILRIKELKAGVTGETPRTSATIREQHHVRDGDLLFSWSGTLLTHRWAGGPAVLNQHIFRVEPTDGIPHWLAEAWIEQHLQVFRGIAADKATTMGHIQRRHLTEATVLVPDESQLADLRRRWDPVDALRMAALNQARTLTAIRDALLPKLVSGQIRVPLSNDPLEGIGAAEAELEQTFI